jgi:hypothetical protein
MKALEKAEVITKGGWKPTGKRGYLVKDDIILSESELYRGFLRFLKASTGKKWA